jgi:hypothetical protein
MMNWKAVGWKRSWPNFKVLSRLTDTTKNPLVRITGLRAETWTPDFPGRRSVNHSTTTFGLWLWSQIHPQHPSHCTLNLFATRSLPSKTCAFLTITSSGLRSEPRIFCIRNWNVERPRGSVSAWHFTSTPHYPSWWSANCVTERRG